MLEPSALSDVVDSAIRKVLVTRTGARRVHAVAAAGGPAMNHGVGHVGMELQAVAGVVANRLHREIVAGGQQLGAIGQLEALAVPVIDLGRPVRAEARARRSGT